MYGTQLREVGMDSMYSIYVTDYSPYEKSE